MNISKFFFHSGLAKAVFKSCKGAQQCVNNLHLKTIMGQSIHCYLDPGGNFLLKQGELCQ